MAEPRKMGNGLRRTLEEVVAQAITKAWQDLAVPTDPHGFAQAVSLAVARPLYNALKVVEFGNAATQHKCVTCSGWDCGPNGETPNAHTKDCLVALALGSVRS